MFERIISSGWGSVTIETASVAHNLGDELEGTVTIEAKQEIGPGHLAVSLVCVQRDVRTIPPIKNRRITRQSHSTEVWRHTDELDADLMLTEGETITFPFSIRLPSESLQGNEHDADLPEWARGTIAVFKTVTFSKSALQWQLRAKFHHPAGFDLRHHVGVLVNPS